MQVATIPTHLGLVNHSSSFEAPDDAQERINGKSSGEKCSPRACSRTSLVKRSLWGRVWDNVRRPINAKHSSFSKSNRKLLATLQKGFPQMNITNAHIVCSLFECYRKLPLQNQGQFHFNVFSAFSWAVQQATDNKNQRYNHYLTYALLHLHAFWEHDAPNAIYAFALEDLSHAHKFIDPAPFGLPDLTFELTISRLPNFIYPQLNHILFQNITFKGPITLKLAPDSWERQQNSTLFLNNCTGVQCLNIHFPKTEDDRPPLQQVVLFRAARFDLKQMPPSTFSKLVIRDPQQLRITGASAKEPIDTLFIQMESPHASFFSDPSSKRKASHHLSVRKLVLEVGPDLSSVDLSHIQTVEELYFDFKAFDSELGKGQPLPFILLPQKIGTLYIRCDNLDKPSTYEPLFHCFDTLFSPENPDIQVHTYRAFFDQDPGEQYKVTSHDVTAQCFLYCQENELSLPRE